MAVGDEANLRLECCGFGVFRSFFKGTLCPFWPPLCHCVDHSKRSAKPVDEHQIIGHLPPGVVDCGHGFDLVHLEYCALW